MKEIKAYIKEFKREAVTHSLMKIDGLTGASFSEVLGFGRSKDKSSGYHPKKNPSGYVKHLKVEVVCDDALVKQVITAVHQAAHTGLRGDGKIYVSDVFGEVRIQDNIAP